MPLNYEKELREAQIAILHILYPEDYKLLKTACKALKIKFERGRQAWKYGKGSTITINGLILHALKIHPKNIQKYIPQLRKILRAPNKLSTLDQLIEEARRNYGENELLAWLRLLNARWEIESEIGIRKKSPGRPRKKS